MVLPYEARNDRAMVMPKTSYGYRVVRDVTDNKGRPVKGLREIDPNKAAVVLRIFQDVADGVSIRDIVKALNSEGIPSPSGGTWAIQTIYSEYNRRGGILNNNLYRGLFVYGKTRKAIDPNTGAEKYVPNPKSEWRQKQVLELQIVPNAL